MDLRKLQRLVVDALEDVKGQDIRVFDTCCTLAHLLGLPQDRTWEGRIVQEAMVS
jgi:hypothetical protein